MKKNKNKKGSFLKKILAIIFLIIICLSIYIIKSGYDIYKDAIASMPISKKVDEVSSSDSYVTLDNIPKTYQEATILIEDKRFYSHQGVDIISIGRAIIKDISTLSLAEGGSTITQQVAKNLYLTQEKNFTRKVAEVFLATKLEEELSKEKILELYLNIIYYGDGYYGIQNASYGYFGKAPASLNLNEQTILLTENKINNLNDLKSFRYTQEENLRILKGKRENLWRKRKNPASDRKTGNRYGKRNREKERPGSISDFTGIQASSVIFSEKRKSTFARLHSGRTVGYRRWICKW